MDEVQESSVNEVTGSSVNLFQDNNASQDLTRKTPLAAVQELIEENIDMKTVTFCQ